MDVGLHALKRHEWQFGQLDNDAITGSHTSTLQHHGHYAGLADEFAAGCTIEHRRKQTFLKVIYLGAGIAEARDFQNNFLADLQVRSPWESEQVYPLCRDVLAQISRLNAKTLLCDFVEQLGMDQVYLAKIGLCGIGLDARTMLHRDALVRVSVHT